MDTPTKIMNVKFGHLLHFICTLLHKAAAPLHPPTPMPLVTVLAYAHMFNITVCLFNCHTSCGNKETGLFLLLISGHVDDKEEGRALTRGLPSTVTQRFIHAHRLVWP